MPNSPMTHQQAKAVAAFVSSIRNDWDEPGVLDALGRARVRASAPDLAVAAIRARQVAANRTPAVIALDGEHWRTLPTGNGYRPARAGEDCEHHPGDYAEHCRGCAADRLAGEETAPRRDTHDRNRVSQHVAEIRAQIAARRDARTEESA